VPIKVAIESLRTDFVERKVKLLFEKITQEVVERPTELSKNPMIERLVSLGLHRIPDLTKKPMSC
jgi:hypothetical protein